MFCSDPQPPKHSRQANFAYSRPKPLKGCRLVSSLKNNQSDIVIINTNFCSPSADGLGAVNKPLNKISLS